MKLRIFTSDRRGLGLKRTRFGTDDLAPGESRFTGARRISTASERAGFTMVEIALCLGIIAFAMVAIIGVLPAGVKVQKENREETIINNDGAFLLEAIRGGAKGIDDLTNYFESITLRYGSQTPITYTNGLAPLANRLTNGQQIVGLLSTPKLQRLPNGAFRQNSVSAHVRALNGVAGEKGRQNEEMAFRYLLFSEVVPFTNRPAAWGASSLEERAQSVNLRNNLYDVRLTMRWPLFQKGTSWDTGRGKKTFRTQVSGELMPFRASGPFSTLYFFDANVFTTTNTLISNF